MENFEQCGNCFPSFQCGLSGWVTTLTSRIPFKLVTNSWWNLLTALKTHPSHRLVVASTPARVSKLNLPQRRLKVFSC
ncbi:hypothetical protein BDY19DRAFT_981404 [Irpex rosettiformis]|uniref:Uncharacterized protein n=1 Tax=Irpex rosettiformis TaxID=378272 RepID=A0ACB8TM19_9APHY|nr:hypothetical protein BDY19DRAFT_981404 [Irpex rosettiformis]